MKVACGTKNELLNYALEFINASKKKELILGFDPLLEEFNIIKKIDEVTNLKIFQLSEELDNENSDLDIMYSSLRVDKKNIYTPIMDSYYQELLFNSLDLAILTVKTDGSFSSIKPNTAFDSLDTTIDGIKITPIKTIMRAKKIIVWVTGEEYSDAIYELLNGLKTESFPASILLDHPDIVLLGDAKALKKI